MRVELVSARVGACLVGGSLAFGILPMRGAFAFPFFDASNANTAVTGAPLGTELEGADVKGLQSQFRLTNPAPAGNPSGWTILPRLSIQEQITDNAYEIGSPRRADAVTVVAPGISITADTYRVQLRLDYAPNILMHAINGPLNAMTQQLNLTGTVTVVPDLAYVDVRGLSGVQSRLGGLAGVGGLGAATSGDVSASSLSGTGVGTGIPLGLNRNNEIQTTSFGLSPYLLRKFGDYGTGKLGVSANESQYSTISGFAANPFPGNGTNSGSLTSTEQIATFTTGEVFQKLQDSFSADLTQTNNRAGASTTSPAFQSSSDRTIISNQITYAINRNFSLIVSGGYENIHYSQTGFRQINDLTWSVGGTWSPNQDSALTVTYGHRNGADSFAANGHFALTARTLLSIDYANTVGTQLEQLQNQLNTAIVGPNGGLTNGTNGGQTLVGTNTLGVQPGVFRFNTLNTSLQTTFDRDTISALVTWTQQLTEGNTGYSVDSLTASASWRHELTPDLSLSSAVSGSVVRRSGGHGSDRTISSAVGLQYKLSPATTVSARYSFFDRISAIPGYSMYENILLLGISKQF